MLTGTSPTKVTLCIEVWLVVVVVGCLVLCDWLSSTVTSTGSRFQRMVFSGMVICRCNNSKSTLGSWLSRPTRLCIKFPNSNMGSPVFGCTRTTGCSFRKTGFSNASRNSRCVSVIDSTRSGCLAG